MARQESLNTMHARKVTQFALALTDMHGCSSCVTFTGCSSTTCSWRCAYDETAILGRSL